MGERRAWEGPDEGAAQLKIHQNVVLARVDYPVSGISTGYYRLEASNGFYYTGTFFKPDISGPYFSFAVDMEVSSTDESLRFRMHRVIDIKRLPLKLRLLEKIIYWFMARQNPNTHPMEAQDLLKEVLEFFHQRNLISALFAPETPNMQDYNEDNPSSSPFLVFLNSNPPLPKQFKCPSEMTLAKCADLVVNTHVLRMHHEMLDMMTFAEYFLSDDERKILLSILGVYAKKWMPEWVIEATQSILLKSPMQLFFEASCPPLIERLKQVPVGIHLTKLQLAEVEGYGLIHNTLEKHVHSGSSCLQVEQVSIHPATYRMLLANYRVVEDQFPDPRNPTKTIKYVYPTSHWQSEETLCDRLVDLIKMRHGRPAYFDPPDCLLEGLDEFQREAVKTAFNKPVFFVSGKPGRGKTHTMALIALGLATFKGLNVLVIAETGNMFDLLRNELAHVNFPQLDPRVRKPAYLKSKNFVDVDAYLNYLATVSTEDSMHGRVFARTAKKVEFDAINSRIDKYTGIQVLIVDEASMHSLNSAARQLQLFPNLLHYGMVGDVKQMLPNDGPTCYPELAKVQHPNIGFVELRKSHRAELEVVNMFDDNLELICRCKPDMPHESTNLKDPWVFLHVVRDGYTKVIEVVQDWRARYGWNTLSALYENLLIITYYNKDVRALNERMFELLFPGKTLQPWRFHPEERIVFMAKYPGKNTESDLFRRSIRVISRIEKMVGWFPANQTQLRNMKPIQTVQDINEMELEKGKPHFEAASYTDKEQWKFYRLVFTNGTNLECRNYHYHAIDRAYVITSTCGQGTGKMKVICYDTLLPEFEPREHNMQVHDVERFNTECSRQMNQLCIVGNKFFWQKRILSCLEKKLHCTVGLRLQRKLLQP